MKGKVQYHFSDTDKGYESSIEDDSGHHNSLGRTSFGHTAYNRFFGLKKHIHYVVKQPKPSYWRGDKDELGNKELINKYKARYEAELQKWNQIHPEHKAILITDQGLRLILPHFPGKTLTEVLYQLPSHLTEKTDQLVYYKVLLAVFTEVKRVHELGFYHGDFKCENILIEEKEDDTFRAYLLDCDGIATRNSLCGTIPPEWLILNHLVDNAGGLQGYEKESCLDYIRLKSIEAHIKNDKDAYVALDKIKSDLSPNAPSIIKVQNSASVEEHHYFVHGCLDNGQWGFTPLDQAMMDSIRITPFSGTLSHAAAPVIVAHIEKQKGHISCKLDRCIKSLQLKMADLDKDLRFGHLTT